MKMQARDSKRWPVVSRRFERKFNTPITVYRVLGMATGFVKLAHVGCSDTAL